MGIWAKLRAKFSRKKPNTMEITGGKVENIRFTPPDNVFRVRPDMDMHPGHIGRYAPAQVVINNQRSDDNFLPGMIAGAVVGNMLLGDHHSVASTPSGPIEQADHSAHTSSHADTSSCDTSTSDFNLDSSCYDSSSSYDSSCSVDSSSFDNSGSW